jgi:enoyl-CoA hydratase/carnithine racemase
MSDAPHLLTEEADGILIATLNRPEKLNAISDEMMDLFQQALHRFRDSDELKVMLIRATGRYFSSGADMKQDGRRGRIDKMTATGIREHLRIGHRNFQHTLDEMEHVEKPIVVAHHAMCVGGGLEMSLSCDFRFAAKSAAYSLPEGMFGLLPASNGVSRLTRICGPHWARWLIMANKPANADKAYTMGLVHDVFPDESFEEEVLEFCRHLVTQNAEQMGAAKIAIEMCAEVGRDTARHVERMATSALMLNPGFFELIDRYISTVGSSDKK